MNDDDAPQRLEALLPSDSPVRLEEGQVLRIAKALADPQRFAILQRIAAEPEVPCKTLVCEFPIKQATISHHLKELAGAGLVDTRRNGQCVQLAARRDVLREYLAELERKILSQVND
ncbi:ArsR/SmtB family transcription factor [Candidatus Laterigemmans baculatus]|uniref:ArsR/SmtB family transcription factor n=1 Tax=Candidatus Laterigemmans baculatus TaxID=2770505 RepID=UPI0013DC05F5|nr:metalloregulator ArsR/SmtB family transcription factor [Candidatus Laterigemmans baculatus]